MENIFNKNFVDGFSSILNIFGDVTISEMAEKIMNEFKEGKSYATYKSETWKNGKCTDQVEKEWEDGKLVKDEGFNSIENIKDTTPKMTEISSCNCSTDNCCSNNKEHKCKCKENLSDYANVELLKENDSLKNEIEHLNDVIRKLKEKNEFVIEENIALKAKLDNIKKLF